MMEEVIEQIGGWAVALVLAWHIGMYWRLR